MNAKRRHRRLRRARGKTFDVYYNDQRDRRLVSRIVGLKTVMTRECYVQGIRLPIVFRSYPEDSLE
jgi:hypothetical protein